MGADPSQSARDAIRAAARTLPQAAVDAAIAAAEDAALELRSVDGMRALRLEDQEHRQLVEAAAVAQRRIVTAAGVVQIVGGWMPQAAPSNTAPGVPQAGWALPPSPHTSSPSSPPAPLFVHVPPSVVVQGPQTS